jgi:hypothetical protein
MDSAGSSYEDCVCLFLGRIASLVHVPREKDFGIDFYFQPRIPSGPQTETVAELGSLQVKGGAQDLVYGGLNARDEWQEYEFTWLRSLATPLYLARVDAGCRSVELFSLWPLWLIFWRQAASPFEVVFATQPFGTGSHIWQDPQSSPHPKGVGKGDGMRWTVDLGPPFLRLTNENMNDSGFRQRAIAVLRTWIAYDRLTLMRYHQFIPVLDGITKWSTDSPEVLEVRTWHFWDSRPGANIERLCRTAAPMLMNLGEHLQWQDDWAAYKLVPILEWLDAQGHLDPIGKGLLDGLRGTQARGVGPAGGVPESHRESKGDTVPHVLARRRSRRLTYPSHRHARLAYG